LLRSANLDHTKVNRSNDQDDAQKGKRVQLKLNDCERDSHKAKEAEIRHSQEHAGWNIHAWGEVRGTLHGVQAKIDAYFNRFHAQSVQRLEKFISHILYGGHKVRRQPQDSWNGWNRNTEFRKTPEWK